MEEEEEERWRNETLWEKNKWEKEAPEAVASFFLLLLLLPRLLKYSKLFVLYNNVLLVGYIINCCCCCWSLILIRLRPLMMYLVCLMIINVCIQITILLYQRHYQIRLCRSKNWISKEEEKTNECLWLLLISLFIFDRISSRHFFFLFFFSILVYCSVCSLLEEADRGYYVGKSRNRRATRLRAWCMGSFQL